MIPRTRIPTQSEIDRAVARSRQLRAHAFADAFARLARLLARFGRSFHGAEAARA